MHFARWCSYYVCVYVWDPEYLHTGEMWESTVPYDHIHSLSHDVKNTAIESKSLLVSVENIISTAVYGY